PVPEPGVPQLEKDANALSLAREPRHLLAQQRQQALERILHRENFGADVQRGRGREHPFRQRLDQLLLALEVKEHKSGAGVGVQRAVATGDRLHPGFRRALIRGAHDLLPPLTLGHLGPGHASSWSAAVIDRAFNIPYDSLNASSTDRFTSHPVYVPKLFTTLR